MSDIAERVRELRTRFRDESAKATVSTALRDLRTLFFGRKAGLLSSALKDLRGLSKEEKRKRLKAWKESEREALESRFPLSRESLEDLFATLDQASVLGEGCDRTCRVTIQ